MTDNTKMTQKEMFAHIAEALADDAAVVEFCNKKIEQLENRKNTPRKPRFNAEANLFAIKVIDFLTDADEPMTNAEIREGMSQELGYTVSAQKVAAALRKIEAGTVMTVDEEGTPVTPIEVSFEAVPGEKKSDPRRFSIN